MKQFKYLLLATVMLAACGGDKKETKDAARLEKLKKDRSELDAKIKGMEAGKTDSTKKTPVTVMTVARTKFTAYIDLQSQITGDDNVVATPMAGGTVTAIPVHVGQHVGKGQVLATLSAPDLEATIQQQQIQANFTKTLYQKQQKLWAQNIGTEVQLLQAKANYEKDLQTLQSSNARRNYARIVAPISGTVDQVDIKIGDVIGAGGGLGGAGIRVVNNDQLKAEARLGESYLGQVQPGAPVTLVFPDINDSLQTKLSYVAQAIDPSSRTFTVQVRLSSNGRLHPNMSCRMKIASYQNSNAIVVPVSVVQKTTGGDVLYVVARGKAQAVKVQTGRTSNGMTEILSGLNDGEQVITEGYQDLDNGDAVVTQ